jgi:5'-nucleotidase
MLNGIVDAMAYGNHDADYGPDVFAQCQAQIKYPILGSNVVISGTNTPLFQYDNKTYKVFEVNKVKIGVFAVVGPDFDRLIKPEYRPAANVIFADRVATAKQIVKALRQDEKVNAVILIGHAMYEDDLALAKAVPGIDVILGTHSHLKKDLAQIPGANTYIISPFQYLTYVDKVELTFSGGKLTNAKGELVRMGTDKPEDPAVAKQVNQMLADLKADPKFAANFDPIGEAAVELGIEGQLTGEAVMGDFVTDIVRNAAQAHMVIATSSSFREPIPPGKLVMGDLYTSMPYKNKILVYDLKGAQIQQVLDYSVSRSGSDFFSQVSGVRFNIVDGKATNIQLLKNPADPKAGYSPLDPAQTYQVATSDFQSKLATGYKDIFAKGTFKETPIEVREETLKFIKANSPVSAKLDGRITLGPAAQPTAAPKPTPVTLPVTGGKQSFDATLPLLAVILLLGGSLIIIQARRKHHV